MITITAKSSNGDMEFQASVNIDSSASSEELEFLVIRIKEMVENGLLEVK